MKIGAYTWPPHIILSPLPSPVSVRRAEAAGHASGDARRQSVPRPGPSRRYSASPRGAVSVCARRGLSSMPPRRRRAETDNRASLLLGSPPSHLRRKHTSYLPSPLLPALSARPSPPPWRPEPPPPPRPPRKPLLHPRSRPNNPVASFLDLHRCSATRSPSFPTTGPPAPPQIAAAGRCSSRSRRSGHP